MRAGNVSIESCHTEGCEIGADALAAKLCGGRAEELCRRGEHHHDNSTVAASAAARLREVARAKWLPLRLPLWPCMGMPFDRGGWWSVATRFGNLGDPRRRIVGTSSRDSFVGIHHIITIM